MHGVVYKYEHKTFENVWETNVNRNNNQNLRNANDLDITTPKFEGFKDFHCMISLRHGIVLAFFNF